MPKIVKFTKENVRKLPLPPKGQQVDHYETLPGRSRSLVLSLSYAGTKSWSVLYYDKTKPRRKKLGRYPDLDPQAARELAHAFDVDAATGKLAAGSFGEIAEQWYESIVRKGLLSAAESRRLLDRHILPAWRDVPFLDVRRRRVIELVEDTRDQHRKSRRGGTGGRGTADGVFAVVRRICSWYASRDETYRSPIDPKMRRETLDLAQPPRQRWLVGNEKNDDRDLRLVWQAAEQMGGPFGALVRILVLTGQRQSKVTQMRWSDLYGSEWTIARDSKREKGTPKAITLPPLAMEIINAQPRLAHNEFVFPAGRGAGAFANHAEKKAELDALLPPEVEPWTLHDLRRTCRDIMTRMEVPIDVAEQALGHALGGVVKIYASKRAYRKPIDAALAKVAAEVQRIVDPSPPASANVVPMARTVG